MKAKSNIIIDKNASVGSASAEVDDEFLFKCFFYHPTMNQLVDTSNPHNFIYGRTGTGKTALMRKIEQDKSNVHIINLKEIALDYVSNSDVIQFFNAMNVDLGIYFQALWKHILCLDYIRLRYNITNEKKSRNVFLSFFNAYQNNAKRTAALNYLKAYEKKYWEDTDVIAREYIEKLENNVKTKMSANIEVFTANAGYVRGLSSEKKENIRVRLKKFIDSSLLAELGKVMQLLKTDEKNEANTSYYILIDKIDENWVDESIRYNLIKALMETQKSFGKIRGLKILISIRADIFERVLQETKEPGFQRDKYDDYLAKLTWDKNSLKELIDSRITHLYRYKYTKDNVTFADVFPYNVGQKRPFDYMLERTLYRPRDIIAYVNECLSLAEGSYAVTARMIRDAEINYSRVRLQSLQDEWISSIPSLNDLIDAISSRMARFKVSDLKEKFPTQDIAIKYSDRSDCRFDPIIRYVVDNFDKWTYDNDEEILKIAACELYRIGAIGLKMSSSERYYYSHIDSPIVNPREITLETRVFIHPFLHRALNINQK